eukprot:666115-Pyramimonas_sp.AAC.1
MSVSGREGEESLRTAEWEYRRRVNRLLREKLKEVEGRAGVKSGGGGRSQWWRDEIQILGSMLRGVKEVRAESLMPSPFG